MRKIFVHIELRIGIMLFIIISKSTNMKGLYRMTLENLK